MSAAVKSIALRAMRLGFGPRLTYRPVVVVSVMRLAAPNVWTDLDVYALHCGLPLAFDRKSWNNKRTALREFNAIPLPPEFARQAGIWEGLHAAPLTRLE